MEIFKFFCRFSRSFSSSDVFGFSPIVSRQQSCNLSTSLLTRASLSLRSVINAEISIFDPNLLLPVVENIHSTLFNSRFRNFKHRLAVINSKTHIGLIVIGDMIDKKN